MINVALFRLFQNPWQEKPLFLLSINLVGGETEGIMKALFLVVLLASVSSTFVSNLAQANLREGTYSLWKGDIIVGEVYVQKVKKNLIQHWVYYDRNEVIGIAPLPSPFPNPDVRTNPSSYPNPEWAPQEYETTIIREVENYRSLKDFLKAVEMDEHSRYFRVTSVEIAPLPSP